MGKQFHPQSTSKSQAPPTGRPGQHAETSLRLPRQKQLGALLALHGGLTLVETRGLARKWKCTPEAILKMLAQWGYPVLDKRDNGQAAGQTETEYDALAIFDDQPTKDEVDELRAENERLRAEVEEARRIQQLSEAEIARARREITKTAELRR